MKTVRHLVALAFLAASSPAIAQEAYIEQVGDGASAAIVQKGRSTAEIRQSADGAQASIDQKGDDHRASIEQSGLGPDLATIVQSGSGHVGAVIQAASAGGGNLAYLSQKGRDNSGLINQAGFGNTASLAQNGRDNLAELTQIGDANSLSATQNGANNVLRYTQDGNNLSAPTIVQHGGANVNVTQK